MMKTFKSHKLMAAALYVSLYLISAGVIYAAVSFDSVRLEQYATARLVLFFLILPLIIKFLIQLVAAIRYSALQKSLPELTENQPKVSVLLPAYNEEVGIIKTIESVLDSSYQNFELIVINDGSTDKTHQLVKSFIKQHQAKKSSTKIDYLALPNGGKAKALNRALSLASGEIVITVDADCVMDKKAISNFVKAFDNPEVGAVAGNVVVGNKKKPIELIQQLEYVCGFFFKRSDSAFSAVHIIGGAAAAYRAEVLQNLRGFDQELITEDVEMSVRILGHGYQTRYAYNAVIYTEGPSDWKGLCNQRLRWKYGRILTYFKHRELFFSRNKQHNRYLSWLVLPLAIYAELILLFQGLILSAFFAYTIISFDYLPLAIMIAFSTSLVSLQVALDSKTRFHRNLFLLAPIAWLLLYVVDFVELQALTRSLKRLFKQESLEWQKWNRVGLAERAVEPSS